MIKDLSQWLSAPYQEEKSLGLLFNSELQGPKW